MATGMEQGEPMDNDADSQLTAWYESQGSPVRESIFHRCPIDCPPCPECQAIQEEENYREYFDQ